MSPEQARGEVLDARSDLFSLGSVLYQMVTGTCQFPGRDDRRNFWKYLHTAPVSPVTLNVRSLRNWNASSINLLEKDRDLRCQVAAEVRADCERLHGRWIPPHKFRSNRGRQPGLERTGTRNR